LNIERILSIFDNLTKETIKKLILLLITILSVHMSFAQIKCGTKDTFTIPVEQIVYYDANDSINSAVGLYKLDSIESSITS
jgi:fumarate reductase subunit D